MSYIDKYQEPVELSRSDNSDIERKANHWIISIIFQDAPERKVSTFQLDLAIKNVKGNISHDEISRRMQDRFGYTLYEEPSSGLDDGYDIMPHDSPRIKEIEEYNRMLRPYAKLDKEEHKKGTLGIYIEW